MEAEQIQRLKAAEADLRAALGWDWKGIDANRARAVAKLALRNIQKAFLIIRDQPRERPMDCVGLV